MTITEYADLSGILALVALAGALVAFAWPPVVFWMGLRA